ncbi:MAG: nucleoside deaminase, partial [Candidatus Gastranaerophilales bacterium]|nr:nucleoside deaminase [Candidatus Gastranaerophilales bacterium]
MNRAIEEALKTTQDVPVGCIITKDNQVITCTHNKREQNNDVTAHAEIEALKIAQKELGNWRLDDCTMYVTLEPCPMCAWAILQSRISTLYFGSYNTQCGAFGTVIDLKQISNSNIKVY